MVPLLAKGGIAGNPKDLEKKPCHLIIKKTELAEVSQVFTSKAP
jgi:hypothetical protein